MKIIDIIEREKRETKEIIQALSDRGDRLATMTDEEKADLERLQKEDEAKYSWMMEG